MILHRANIETSQHSERKRKFMKHAYIPLNRPKNYLDVVFL